MRGTKTQAVFDLLADVHGMGVACSAEVDYSEAIFSDGFLCAMNQDKMMPILGSEVPNTDHPGTEEWHHMIVDGECYRVGFRPMTDEEVESWGFIRCEI